MMKSEAGDDEAVVAVVAAAEAAIANVRSREDLPPDVNVRTRRATPSARPMTSSTPIAHSTPNEITTSPTSNVGTMRIVHGDRVPKVGPPPMTIVHADVDAVAAVAEAADARAKPLSVRPPPSELAPAIRLTSTTNRCR